MGSEACADGGDSQLIGGSSLSLSLVSGSGAGGASTALLLDASG